MHGDIYAARACSIAARHIEAGTWAVIVRHTATGREMEIGERTESRTEAYRRQHVTQAQAVSFREIDGARCVMHKRDTSGRIVLPAAELQQRYYQTVSGGWIVAVFHDETGSVLQVGKVYDDQIKADKRQARLAEARAFRLLSWTRATPLY